MVEIPQEVNLIYIVMGTVILTVRAFSYYDTCWAYLLILILYNNNNNNNNNNNKINLWLTAPKVNLTSATDWQMAVRRDNVISITLRQV